MENPKIKFAKNPGKTGSKEIDTFLESISKKEYTSVAEAKKDLAKIQEYSSKYKNLNDGNYNSVLHNYSQAINKVIPETEKYMKESARIDEAALNVKKAEQEIRKAGGTELEVQGLHNRIKGREWSSSAVDDAKRDIFGNIQERKGKQNTDAFREKMKTEGASHYNQRLINVQQKLADARQNPSKYNEGQIKELNNENEYVKNKLMAVEKAGKLGYIEGFKDQHDITSDLAGQQKAPLPVNNATETGGAIPNVLKSKYNDYSDFVSKASPTGQPPPQTAETPPTSAPFAPRQQSGLVSKLSPPAQSSYVNQFTPETGENDPAMPQESPVTNDILKPVAVEAVQNGGTDPALNTPPQAAPQSGNKFNWGQGLNSLVNYGVPLAQTIMGYNALQKAGDRPIDTQDPDFLASLDTARTNRDVAVAKARYGWSPEENSYFNQQNQGLLNSERFAARNYSGGNAGNAFTMEQAAINNSFNRGLQSKIANRELMNQKQLMANQSQQYVDALTERKMAKGRQLHDDRMNAFLQNQQAGSQLLGAGLNNLAGAGRYSQYMNSMNDINQKYGNG